MKKIKNIILSVLLVTVLVCSLAACGNDSDSVKGKTMTWGNMTVFVPDGMTLTGGSITDSSDPNTLWLKVDNKPTNYFLISVREEESAKLDIESTKEFNGGDDITAYSVKGTEWNGVTYDYNGEPCVQMYGNGFEIMSFGFAYDSDVTAAIAASLAQ